MLSSVKKKRCRLRRTVCAQEAILALAACRHRPVTRQSNHPHPRPPEWHNAPETSVRGRYPHSAASRKAVDCARPFPPAELPVRRRLDRQDLRRLSSRYLPACLMSSSWGLDESGWSSIGRNNKLDLPVKRRQCAGARPAKPVSGVRPAFQPRACQLRAQRYSAQSCQRIDSPPVG